VLLRGIIEGHSAGIEENGLSIVISLKDDESPNASPDSIISGSRVLTPLPAILQSRNHELYPSLFHLRVVDEIFVCFIKTRFTHNL
jgi:hypothetical protein